jgi:hypothetical protein
VPSTVTPLACAVWEISQHLAAMAEPEAVAELVEDEHAPARVGHRKQRGEHELNRGELLLRGVGPNCRPRRAPTDWPGRAALEVGARLSAPRQACWERDGPEIKVA